MIKPQLFKYFIFISILYMYFSDNMINVFPPYADIKMNPQ